MRNGEKSYATEIEDLAREAGQEGGLQALAVTVSQRTGKLSLTSGNSTGNQYSQQYTNVIRVIYEPSLRRMTTMTRPLSLVNLPAISSALNPSRSSVEFTPHKK